ncbi:flavin reductase family protein [Brachybacterium kimchii]|uniref:Flavin reductase n=1 Tax=Brachybacterium kimchii TaxID=2942909 RepID=A0ABY4N562_9MICO|nr:flavin reductase [Brachybacterium kimchii]UQN28598.1 flavin reductase [Brachybacterium kimchii]
MHISIDPSVYYFGTTIALVTTLNEDGTSNITPISSAWALGRTYVLGFADDSHAMSNLRRRARLVINLPDASLADRIEAIADTTGADPVPARKRAQFRSVRDKWSAGGFTPVPADHGAPARIAECPVQLEAHAARVMPCEDGASAVHAPVSRVLARSDHVLPGTSHIDLGVWRPCLYTFRHYFAQGEEVARSFRAEY